VPELAGLGGGEIHKPWTAAVERLSAAGIELGETYPLPIVDHIEARADALAAYSAIRGARA
jgi:deoxyribodipyrimidine photo-lyase